MEEQAEDPEKRKLLEARKAEAQLKSAMRSMLEDEAYDRIMNVSHANKELYMSAAKAVLALFRRAGRRLTDGELVRVLMAINKENESATSITFHRK